MKISSRVKEKVARIVGETFKTTDIVNVFTDAKVSVDTELYAKWRITLDGFSKTNGVNEILSIIEEFCHPLNFDDSFLRDVFIHSLNEVLAYDDLKIEYSEKTAKIHSTKKDGYTWDDFNITIVDGDRKTSEEIEQETNEQVEIQKEDKDLKKIIENKESVRQLRDFHQMLIDVVETFCQNLKKPSKELNDSYLFLMKKIQDIVQKLDLRYHTLTLYRPFKDLYSAEIEWNGTGDIGDIRLNPKLSWDAVRPSLYKAHSDIVKICAIAEEDSKMTDDQKKLEEIAGLVAKARTEKANTTGKQRRAFPIEIISPIQISKEVHTRAVTPLTPRNIANLKVDMSAGDLEAFNDGSIRYKEVPIEMRGQLIALCRLFIGRPNRLVTIDDIREELIRADKRKSIPNKTLAKYVSELRAILMSHFKRDVFVNQKEDGWFFRP